VAIVIMALVNPQGQVVNKIVVDTEKPFTPPPGWSMHEWDERVDGPAYAMYIASKATVPPANVAKVEKAANATATQNYALIDDKGQVVSKIVADPASFKLALPPGWMVRGWVDAVDGPACEKYLASLQTAKKQGLLARLRAKLKSNPR